MQNAIIRAISIRQPFVEMILRGTKKIEYRSRKTNIRECVYLYASLTIEIDICEEEGLDYKKLPTGLTSLIKRYLAEHVGVIASQKQFHEYDLAEYNISIYSQIYIDFSIWLNIIDLYLAKSKKAGRL